MGISTVDPAVVSHQTLNEATLVYKYEFFGGMHVLLVVQFAKEPVTTGGVEITDEEGFVAGNGSRKVFA